MQAMAEGFDIEAIEWSEPKIIPTRGGEKRMREWYIPDELQRSFWDEWRTGKLKSLGYQVAKWQGAWKLVEWRNVGGSQTDRAKRETTDPGDIAFEPELPERLRAAFEQLSSEWPEDYDYQLPHIKRLVTAIEREGFAVDASETGTGKTACAMAVAKLLGLWPFIVTPKQVIPPWLRTARMIDIPLRDGHAVNYEKLRTGKLAAGEWEINDRTKKKVRFKWDEEELRPETTLLIFDECQRLKDFTTQSCKMGIAAIEAGYKIMALSATAADNPMHMKFIALGTRMIRRAGDFYGWLMHQGMKKGRFGMFFVGGKPVLTRLHAHIFPRYGSRMRISELGDKFPETKIISQAYQMDESAEIQSVYEEMNREIAQLEAREAGDVKGTQAAILTAKLRGRQRAELLKVPTLIDMANDAIERSHSVLLFVNFEATLRALALRLQTNAVIHGGQKEEDRQSIIDGFNSYEIPLVIANIKAGGVGVDLKGRKGGNMIESYISPTYSGIDLKQVLGRPQRGGGANSLQYIVWAAGTIEEEACEKVRAKLDRVTLINDGSLDEALQF
jgi:superfamily II DNA or RNA helicase